MKRKIFSVLFALVLVVSFSLIPAVPAAASGTTYYVATTGSDTTGDGSSGMPWLTISYALTQVSAGDTIEVRPGTYLEWTGAVSAGCAVDVPYFAEGAGGLTIQSSDGAANTIIDCGWAGWGVQIVSNEVTFTGFTVKNAYSVINQVSGNGHTLSNLIITDFVNYGLGVAHGVDCEFSNITIHGNDVSKSENRTVKGIDFIGYGSGGNNDCQFEDITIYDIETTGTYGTSFGIYWSTSSTFPDWDNAFTDVTIHDLTAENWMACGIYIKGRTPGTAPYAIENTTFSGGSIYNIGSDAAATRGFYVDGGCNNLSISGFDITGCDKGIYFSHHGREACKDVGIHFNNIAGNTEYGVQDYDGDNDVDATHNWWGDASGPSGVGPGDGDAVSDNIGFFPWALNEGCTEIANSDTTVVVVDDDWAGSPDYAQFIVDDTDYYIGVNAFAIIQEAIDAVTEGGTVSVAAGTYRENITIDKSNLALVGEDRETTIIDATQDSSWPVAKPGILIGEYPLVDGVHGVTVSGFTIRDAAMQEGGVPYGGDKYGVGPGGLAGIQIYNSSSNIIEDNILINNYWQIWLVAEWPAAGYTECKNNRIAYNIIEDSENDGVYLYSDGGVFVQDTEIIENEISSAYGERASGIEFWGWPEGGDTPTISGTVISNNDITGCTFGVRIRSDVEDITGTSVNLNNFADNSIQVLDATETLDIQLVLDANTFDRAVVIDRPSGSLLHTIWSKIQDSVDSADTDDTVLVQPGTYEETVEVDVEDLTICSSKGPLVTTVKGADVGYYDIAFQVIAPGVTIEGFTIDQDRSTLDDPVGTGFNRPAIMIGGCFPGDMRYLGVERVTIRDNIFVDTWSAIYIYHSSHNLIEGNLIEGCYWRSIQIYDGTVDAEIAYDSGHTYIGLSDWQGNELSFTEGELIYPSQYNRIIDNEIANGHFGGIFVGAWTGSGGLWADNTGTEITGNYIHDDSDIATGTAFSSGPKVFFGNRIESCGIGIFVFGDGVTGVTVHFNNIVGNTEFGVLNETPGTVDATNNWWGHASGPHPRGTGNPVSGDVTYSPWIGAGVEDSRSEETESGPDTVDARTEADTEVIKSGAGTPTITVAEYSSNPGRGFGGDIGKYVDVHVDDSAGVDEIEIRVYYTDAEIGGLVESSLILRWWDGTRWVACSDTGVTTTNIPPYSGYIWAKIRNDTRPTLAQLSGTAFGGSGRAPAVPAPPPPAPPVPPPGTTDVRGMVSTAGIFLRLVTAISEDGLCTLTIPEGTVGLTAELEPLTEITIVEIDEPPPPPEGAYIIGLAYDFQPSGATFELPVTLKYTYDPADIPEDVAEEDLVIAYYDEAAGEWVVLKGCVVDPVADTVTAPVAHFTAFRAMVFIPAPVAFSLSGLEISPAEAEIGSTITISAVVENTGGQTGSYNVTLKIDGMVEATKEVTLDAGTSERVSFTTSRDVAGSYSVDVNGLAGSFAVKEKPASPEVSAPVKPFPWPLVGGIIAGVVVVGLLVFFLVRRRRAY